VEALYDVMVINIYINKYTKYDIMTINDNKNNCKYKWVGAQDPDNPNNTIYINMIQ